MMLNGEKVMMKRKTIDFPDSDTTPYLHDYYICPQDHCEEVPGTGRYSKLID